MHAPQAKKPAVIPWSISSLTAFETCPKRFYLTRIAKKVTEPQTEATLHGNEVHKSLELAVAGTQALPPKHRAYQPIIMKVMQAPGVKQTERKFALTASFKPTEFFAKDAWVRGVIDLTIARPKTALVLDWKTGKPKADTDQLKLTAAVLFAEKPYLEKVTTGYVWLAHNKIDRETYARDEVPGIWSEFLPRVNRMVRSLETDQFPPKPSGLCREWCPVGKSLCEFCGKD
jgi:hypothetical protein